MRSETYYLKRDWSFIEKAGQVVLMKADYSLCYVSNQATHLLRLLAERPHTEEELLAAVEEKLDLTECYYLLEQLKQRGVIGCTPAARHHFLLIHTEEVTAAEVERLAALLSEEDEVEVAGQWEALREVAPDNLVVLCVPHYHHPALTAFNRIAHAQHWHWMPLAIGDDELWVGPRFESGEGCFECLGFRFYHQSPVVHYAYLQSDCHLSTHRASWRQLLAAAELLREEADAKEQRLTLVKRTGETTEREHHFLRPWPHCPICMGEQPVEEGVPVRLQSRPKIGYTDGGDRTEEAQATIRRLIDRVDPFTSEVGRLTPVVTPEEGYGYSMVVSQWATLRNADRLWNGAVDWKKGRIQSLGVSAGKGQSLAQAEASALGESIERYSSQYFGYEPTHKALWREVADQAISPRILIPYSESQYAHREEWGKKSDYSHIPEAWNEEIPLHWSKGWSLTHQQLRWLPTSYLFYNFLEEGVAYMYGDSNGVSAGNCREEAIMQGFFELIERDAAGAWWYNQALRPQLDLDAWPEPSIQRFRRRMGERGFRVWALDLTTEFRIPVVIAIAQTDNPNVPMLLGLGAHYRVEVALQRALAELTQSLREDTEAPEGHWWHTVRQANPAYLYPDLTQPMRRPADFIDQSTDDLLTDIERAVALMRAEGMELIVHDLTRPETGLNVMRVIVPGLSHFWPRFGDPRIYQHPVRLGWTARVLTEEELNPVPFPF